MLYFSNYITFFSRTYFQLQYLLISICSRLVTPERYLTSSTAPLLPSLSRSPTWKCQNTLARSHLSKKSSKCPFEAYLLRRAVTLTLISFCFLLCRYPTYITFPFTLDSPFLPHFNQVLREMMQSGTLNKIWDGYQPVLTMECEEKRVRKKCSTNIKHAIIFLFP